MKLNQPMENRQLSSFFGRCLFVGLGLGTGIAIGIYIAKKLSQIDRTGEIVLALNDVSHEIKELRSSVLMHLEKTTLIDRSRKLYRQVSNHEVTTAISDYLPADEADESSSEEDFFDLQDDELISNKQRLLCFLTTSIAYGEETLLLSQHLFSTPYPQSVCVGGGGGGGGGRKRGKENWVKQDK